MSKTAVLNNRLTDGSEVDCYAPDAPLAPGIFLVLISVRDEVEPRVIVRLEESDQQKKSMTFRLCFSIFTNYFTCQSMTLEYSAQC
jgi:hypothetical protein